MNKKETSYILKWNKKIKIFEFMGGMCEKCGDKNIIHMVFHHNNPLEKENELGVIINGSLEKILKEIEKCILLCDNCHRELHYNIDNLSKSAIERRNNKNIMVTYKNNKCEICGYDKCLSSLVFHHKNEKDKTIDIGHLGKKLVSLQDINDKIKEELDNCILICSNCHRDVHFDKELFEKYKCEIFKKEIVYKQSKINRNDILEKYKNGYTKITELAKIFNTSKGTISPIIKKFKIDGVL